MISIYDRTEEFKKNCAPLLEQLRDECLIYNVPFFFTACVKNTDAESVYFNDGILTGADGLKLSDDQLKKHLLVAAGFDVIPKKSDIEITMDDVDLPDDDPDTIILD